MEYWGRNLSYHIYDNYSKWYFFIYVLASDSSKSWDFLFFFSFIPPPPSFSFLHSFLLSSFLPLFLLTYTTLGFSLSLPSYLSSLFFSFFSLPPPLFPPCTSKLNSDLMNSHLQPQLTEETLTSVGHLLSLGLTCIDEI